MGFMTDGLSWLAEQRETNDGRTVTYRRPSTGESAEIEVTVGQTQLVNVNSLSLEPQAQDMAVLNAEVTNRDYIIRNAKTQLGALWPPVNGDLIDDSDDEDGSVYRYQVMSLPGQNPWRWFRGGAQKNARIHTKFISTYALLWQDTFTDTNATNLEDHEPDIGDGYSGGSDDVLISSNRIVGNGFRFFDPGEPDVTARVDFRINLAAGDLELKWAELGLGVRCESSGSGQRDGYYCTLRIGYADNEQQTKRLKLVKRSGGSNTEVAALDLSEAIDLDATYRLEVVADSERILFSLFDSTGEVSIASVSVEPDAFTDNTACAVIFAHHEDLEDTGPWMDSLEVEG